MTFQPNADELLANNAAQAAGFESAGLQVAPTRQLAVVACMDSRMDIFEILGLENGEAHIIRNAGGIITDDVIRSLCLSQRFLGTREVILVHHTDCGLEQVDEAAFEAGLEEEVGVKPNWALGAFEDPYRDVAQSIRSLMMSPFIRDKDHIRGFVYQVTSGQLAEVTPDPD